MKKRKTKKVLSFLLSMALIVSCLSFSPDAFAKTKNKKNDTSEIKSVSITNVPSLILVLKKKQNFTLKVSVKENPKDTKKTKSTSTKNKKETISKKVTFKSSNVKVVSVNKNGKLKALKNGTAKITVRSKVNPDKKASIKVSVGIPVKSVVLSNKTCVGNAGQKVTLTANVQPKSATYKKLGFASSNTKVAKVSSNGVVSFLAKGTAKITVSALDGSKKKAVCTITVNEQQTPATPAPTPTPPAPAPPAPAPTAPAQQPAEPTSTPQSPDPAPLPTFIPPMPSPVLDLSYDEYHEVWEDQFQGDSLNRDDWNVETHDKGWADNEEQEYVDSSENIKVHDGNLEIRPRQTTALNGETVVSSGRINTKQKHDFKYGLFEVRAKVPSGKGFLSAFSMLPTDESLYGLWPRSGEIDAMNLKGQDNTTAYGGIVYGDPKAQSKNTYTLSDGSNFSDEYHTFSCEWEPGKIRWYVDGILYHEETDWYSTTQNQGTVTYPAPFDQPFFLNLYLSVGGDVAGPSDETTDFENSCYYIDSVKIYQKDSYNDNVEAPGGITPLVIPSNTVLADGNYIYNGGFQEGANRLQYWSIENPKGATISVTNEYNIRQLKVVNTAVDSTDTDVVLQQENTLITSGKVYKLTFDAKADTPRSAKVLVGENEYMVELTTSMKSFTINIPSDATFSDHKVKFYLGGQGTITLDNVKLKEVVSP